MGQVELPLQDSSQLKFSIVVPVFNVSSTIVRAIASICNQSYSQVEVIVIDGASSDDTLEKIRAFESEINTILSEPDLGLYDAVNKGIRHATGNIVAILNGDDYYACEKIFQRYAEAFLHTSASIVFADVEFFLKSDPNQIKRYYSSARFRPSRMRFGWMPPHPTVFVRREVYEKIGLYRTDYQISADYEFLVRALLKHRVSYARIDSVVVRMQHGGMSTSGLKATYQLNKEIIRACRENGVYTNWLMLLSKGPAKLLEYLPRFR